MNSLSIFIYLIGLIPTLKTFLLIGTMLTAVLIGTILTAVVASVWFVGVHDTIGRRDDEELARIDHFWKCLRRRVVPGILCAVGMIVLIPSRETMILIASSEVGEKVLRSETVQSIVDPSTELLKEWIKKQLEDIRKDK